MDLTILDNEEHRIDDEPVDEPVDEPAEPKSKRTRIARKLTWWIFGNKVLENGAEYFQCRLGCIDDLRRQRIRLKYSGTSSIKRHIKSVHSAFYKKFMDALQNKYNAEGLREEVQKRDQETDKKLEKGQGELNRFFQKVSSTSPVLLII